MLNRSRMGLTAIALAGATAILLAGCSSNASGSGGSASAGAGGPNLDLAKQIVDPQVNTGTRELPLNIPTTIPAGLTMDYLDIGTPVSATMWQTLADLGPLVGINFQRIQTGSSPEDINSTMNTVVENKPSAVINVGIDPQYYSQQLDQLRDAGVPMVAASINNGEQYGLKVQNSADVDKYAGKSMLAEALLRTNGQVTHFVYINTPELPFSSLERDGAHEALADLCPSCTLDDLDIPVADIGSTAPDQIISYFQAHPDTGYYIASLDENTIGLPAKEAVAGLEIKGVGQTPTPVNLQQIADGSEDAAQTGNLMSLMYTLVEQALLELNHQDYSFPDAETLAGMTEMFITKDPDTLPADLQLGWQPSPTLQDDFLKMWGVKK